jgi:hypothetical protein
MADGRQNNGGKRKGAGNPGYGKRKNLVARVDKFEPFFWDELEKMITGDDKADRKYAMTEFNKIQLKMIPQDITSGGKEIPQPIMNLKYVQQDNSNIEDNSDEQENKSDSWGNECVKDNLDNTILDSKSSK